MSAPLTSGGLTSFPGTGAEFSQPCPVGEERRGGGTGIGVLSPTSSALQLLKLPGAAGAELLLGRGSRCAGKVPLLDGASRCLQQAGPRKVIQDNAVQDPGWVGMAYGSVAVRGGRAGAWSATVN